MDTDALKTNLRNALKTLPPDVTAKVTELLNFTFDNLPKLKACIPAFKEHLGQDVTAIAFECSWAGTEKTFELIEPVIREVFSEFGIKPDDKHLAGAGT